MIIQNNYEEKSCVAYKIFKNYPSKKWDYSSIKCHSKLLQWIEDMAQRGLGLYLRKKTWI